VCTVAIYYMNVQVIGRSAGRSATGAAAYRAGERIVDERTGQVYDYTRRRGDIETEILTPAGAPAWAQDRSALWNQVEKAERRGDAQVAREIVVALPMELDRAAQWELVRAYAQEQFVSRGMVADVAIHRNPGNPHAHIMLTMREMGPEGLSSKKNREWNKPELLLEWREQWAVQANRALERAGQAERIDHRSLAEQGAERLPQVHLGPHAAALERRGIATEKGEHNRAVAEHNVVVIDLEKARQERRQLRAEKAVMDRYGARLQAGWLPVHAQALGKLEYHLGGEVLNRSQVVEGLGGYRQELRQLQEQVQAINQEGRRLDRAAELLGHRQHAGAEVERLKKPLAAVKRWFSADARGELKQAQERLETLDETLKQTGTTSESELQQQRVRWHQEQARVPALEEKGARLDDLIGWAAKALEGFTREQEREYDYLYRGKRSRDRDTGRGR
jgi:ATP-dependent exoDNAse (exonuclease V) alpha subunit